MASVRLDVISIGTLSRNRLWGESADRPHAARDDHADSQREAEYPGRPRLAAAGDRRAIVRADRAAAGADRYRLPDQFPPVASRGAAALQQREDSHARGRAAGDGQPSASLIEEAPHGRPRSRGAGNELKLLESIQPRRRQDRRPGRPLPAVRLHARHVRAAGRGADVDHAHRRRRRPDARSFPGRPDPAGRVRHRGGGRVDARGVRDRGPDRAGARQPLRQSAQRWSLIRRRRQTGG